MTEEQNNNYVKLIHKRGVIKGVITRIKSFVDSASSGKENKILVQARLDVLNENWNSFKIVQEEIEDVIFHNKELLGEQEKERENFELRYFEVKSGLVKILQDDNSNKTDINQLVVGDDKNRIKLPSINLPKFNGTYGNWITFHDTFKSLIDSNVNISNVEKHHYLVSSLEGKAADLINNISISDSNYETAWNRLCERYNNNKLIIDYHLSRLFSIKKLEYSSAFSLRDLFNNYKKNLEALKNFKLPIDNWSAILVYLITSKLDKDTLKAWEEATPHKEYPTFEQLENFLEGRCVWLESFECKEKNKGLGNKVNSNVSSNRLLNQNKDNRKYSNMVRKFVCILCQDNHELFKCKSYCEKGIEERRELVKNNKLCWQCLKAGHRAIDCRFLKCKVCNGRHHQTLCIVDKNFSLENKSTTIRKDSLSASSLCTYSKNKHKEKSQTQVLLATANIFILDKDNNPIKTRVILDSGSEVNLLSQTLANKLNLKYFKCHDKIVGINNTASDAFCLSAEIMSHHSNYKMSLDFKVISSMTSLNVPKQKFDINEWNLPPYILRNLADPYFNSSNDNIEGILGAEVFFKILSYKRFIPRGLVDNDIIIVLTKLGWVVTGRIEATADKKDTLCCVAKVCPYKETEIPDLLFNTPEKDSKNIELFKYQRAQEGNFIVRLPFKSEPSVLGKSYIGAQSRFLKLEYKFKRDPALKEKYFNFIKEYIDLGHMEVVPDNEKYNRAAYYLPHHPIFKDSTTTQLRVVFDASFKASNGYSLNDILNSGPVLQNDLFNILLNFRFSKYALMADVGKAFRQIWLDKSQVDAQRILWRDSPDKEIAHYRLLTVTYGTTCAPYLMIRCFHQIAEDIADKFPHLSNIITDHFYMDDLMTGCDNEDDLRILQRKLVKLFKQYGFDLRKWCSNSLTFLNKLEDEKKGEHYTVKIGDNERIKALGLEWDPLNDHFKFKIHSCYTMEVLCRRKILSDVSKFWDPLGFVAPVLIRAKMFVQELTSMGFKWDESLPSEISEKWIKFRSELVYLSKIEVRRFVDISTISDCIQLHGFSDASEKAYGACIYVVKKNTRPKLLCAKAKVAPIKYVTIPRLELLAILLLKQLMERVVKLINIKDKIKCVGWSDSKVALTWIEGSPSQWKTYVSNRVVQIQDCDFTIEWRYVKTAENPADIVSRGVIPNNLQENAMWWEGPHWLSNVTANWPKSEHLDVDVSSEELEKKKIKLSLLTKTDSCNLFLKYSSWTKLLRVVGYIRRFYYNCRHSTHRRKKFLSVLELKEAEINLLRLIQEEEFQLEFKLLKRDGMVGKKSKLISLNPFIGDNGLIKVGGRLTKSDVSDSQKHPVVLPHNHPGTILILRYFHIKYFHAGAQAVLTAVRNEYWPINGKRLIRSVIHKCVICKRYNAKEVAPFMADLPKSRVCTGRPFQTTGIDFCGPVYIKEGLRKSIKKKAWIAIFVCFITRAVHVELVSDLSSEAFLAALRRFFARRGKCTDIYTDNGTNFVGASRELRKMLLGSIRGASIGEIMATEGIIWHFIPPGGPHFGGLWESAVKALKYHLKRVMNGILTNFEECSTLLAQVEAILNSRPLTSLSSDPNDFSALTPAHFLVGGPLTIPAEPNYLDVPANRLRRWKLLQKSMQHFWKRWSSEYLSSLQQRAKWRTGGTNIEVGMLVLLKEDNLAPFEWKMGRVVETHPGADGIIRVASVATANGQVFKRPVVKLCLLLEN